jgi:hypothetical protein
LGIVHLAIDSGGAAWDINYLRDRKNTAAFTQALLAIKVNEISTQATQGTTFALINATPTPAKVDQVITLDASQSYASHDDVEIIRWE